MKHIKILNIVILNEYLREIKPQCQKLPINVNLTILNLNICPHKY